MVRWLNRFDVRVCIVYATVSILWITFSDSLALLVFPGDQVSSAWFSLIKGWGFVAVTAAGLYFILSRELRRRSKLEETLHIEIGQHLNTLASLQRMTRLYHMLSDSNQALVRAADEYELLTKITRLLVTVGGYAFAWVGYARNDPDRLVVPITFAGAEDNFLSSIRVTWDDSMTGQGPSGTSIRTGQPCIIRFISADARFETWKAEAVKRGYASVIGLPIKVNERVIGTLGVYSVHEDAFDPSETNLLSELALDIGYGIQALRTANEQKHSADEIAKVNRELAMLNRVVSLVGSTLDTERVLESACQELAAIFQVPRVSAAIMDEVTNDFRFIAEFGGPPSGGKTRFVVGEHDTESVMVIPIVRRGTLGGILRVESDTPRDFTEAESTLAATLAHAISPALENSLLHEQVTLQNMELERIVQTRTQQLERLNAQMATILNNTSDAILLLNTRNEIENTNPTFNVMFGYGRQEMVGQPITSLVDTKNHLALTQALEKIRVTRQLQRVQVLGCSKQGRTFDADIAIACVLDDEGKLVCSVRDITHLKEIEHMKDQFISMVSHELKTPISAIMLTSETVDRYFERLNEQQKRDKIRLIRREVTSLSDLVMAILDTARFDGQRGLQPTEKIDVSLVLHEVASEMIPQAEARQQIFSYSVEEEKIWTQANYTDIARVWRNLLSNAIKYTAEGGRIDAKLLRSRDSARLVAVKELLPGDISTGETEYLVGMVSDNGPGISEADQKQLFTRFFRGWAAGTRISGTGLGLSLVRDILRSYRGDIAVKSELRTGTTFVFWIPLT